MTRYVNTADLIRAKLVTKAKIKHLLRLSTRGKTWRPLLGFGTSNNGSGVLFMQTIKVVEVLYKLLHIH